MLASWATMLKLFSQQFWARSAAVEKAAAGERRWSRHIFQRLNKASNARPQAFLWSPAFELLAIQDVHWVSDGIFANVILKPPKP